MGQVTSTGNKQPQVVAKSYSTLEFETGKKVLNNHAKIYKAKTEIALNGSTHIPKVAPECSLDDLVDLVFNKDVEYSSDADCDSDEELTKTVPTVFRWENGGDEVFLSGSFTDWNTRIPMSLSNGEFATIIELPEGEHQFKFYVDGLWIHDPNLPTTCDSYGGRNNVVAIQKSDFEVMAALNSDEKKPISSLGRRISTSESYGQLIPSHNNPVVVRGSGLHSSVPPALPPHLLNVNLNKGVLNVNEPSLLQKPDHVSINHLYALSIKDGVMVVSSCLRYREKYITTLLYRPAAMP